MDSRSIGLSCGKTGGDSTGEGASRDGVLGVAVLKRAAVEGRAGDVVIGEEAPFIAKGMCLVLGTFVTITVARVDLEQAERAIRLAFREIFRIHHLMNAHSADSEVGQLNRNGYHDRLSPDTWHVIQRALYFSALTDGAFDVTILPLLELWDGCTRRRERPTAAELEERLKRVGYRNIEMKGGRIRFLREGMRLTLAGVAKGYAVDKAAEVLAQNNIRHALINGGGDIRAVGGKADNVPWKIGLRDPLEKTRLLTTIELADQAVATSGTHPRRLDDLLNPRSGKPPKDILSATIVAERTADADALATAFFVLGGRKGQDVLKRFGDARSLYVAGDGRFHTTEPRSGPP